MELILKMNTEEAITVAENGSLKTLIESFREKVEVSATGRSITESDVHQPQPVGQPAASAVPTWTPGGGLIDDSISQAPAAPEPQPMVSAVPTEAKSYTAADLQKAAISLMDKGVSMDAIAGALAKHGVNSLPELTPDKFGAFALDLRQLGADI